MSDETLKVVGHLIGPDVRRDAIHVAVEPVVASERLQPGQHVGFVGRGTVSQLGPHVGIVDPFLDRFVEPGERFLLFVFPRRITGLRHVWSHPDFDDEEVLGSPAYSRRWIESFAAKLGKTFNELMDAARLWIDDNEYSSDPSERYKDYYREFGTFWHHYELVTQQPLPDHVDRENFFTCSCG